MADNRLMAMLQGAKNVMNKVETGDFKRGDQGYTNQGVTSDQLVENVNPQQMQQAQPVQQQQQQRQPTQQELQAQLQAQTMQQQQPNEYAPRPAAQPIPQTYRNLHTSKMPPSILEAMVKDPQNVKIPASLGGEAFSIQDVAALVNPQGQQPQQPRMNEHVQQPIQSGVNQYGQKTVTLTEAELDAKIKNALFEFMSTTFTKTLTEATIKKTMGMLIREGKLKVTQKKKV
jgi:hypothetical protein